MFDNARLVITGWGSNIDSIGPSTELLNKAMLQYINKEVCQTYFVDRRISDSQICTSANYFIGTCTVNTSCYILYIHNKNCYIIIYFL